MKYITNKKALYLARDLLEKNTIVLQKVASQKNEKSEKERELLAKAQTKQKKE